MTTSLSTAQTVAVLLNKHYNFLFKKHLLNPKIKERNESCRECSNFRDLILYRESCLSPGNQSAPGTIAWTSLQQRTHAHS